MGWVVSSNRLACMIIQAKVITIHLVEQKGIMSQDFFFTQACVCLPQGWCKTEYFLSQLLPF